MKLQMQTKILQELTAKAIKGASNNKLVPITSLMLIRVEDDDLTIVTTDAVNYLYCKELSVDSDDFYLVINADIFAKLISKMTSDTITLTIKENALEVIGNGTYLIDIPLDENGEYIKYPDPLATSVDIDDASVVDAKIELATVRIMLDNLKSALAVVVDDPCYTNYYVGDTIVATDTFTIANYDKSVLYIPKLLSADLINLLGVMSDDMININVIDDTIIFDSTNCIVYGKCSTGLSEYRIDAIRDLINTEFDSMCKVPKAEILRVLDRIALFVNQFDKNSICLTFRNDSLQIASKASNSIEIIDYIESENAVNFTGYVDIEMLINQIKSYDGDALEIYYGLDSAIKFKSGPMTQIIALLED